MQAIKADEKLNNFGLLRILFATLVIESHSFELIDGNRTREILTRVFGTISFGDFAVDGFFLVSGYLITKSYFNSATIVDYFQKRVFRIYPGFMIAFCFSIFLAILILHIYPTPKEILDNIFNVIVLQPPNINNVYPNSYYPALDGAMWTISYEFRCYLLIAVLGLAGILKRKEIILVLTIFILSAFLFYPEQYRPYAHNQSLAVMVQHHDTTNHFLAIIKNSLMGDKRSDIRLFAVFLTGSCFYLFRDQITYKSNLLIASGVVLCGAMLTKTFCEPALAVIGGYLLFWFAVNAKPLKINSFLNKTDLSYGIYLYAWPVQKALIFTINNIGPYQLICSTLAACLILSTLSWKFIEKPTLNFSAQLIKARNPPRV